MFKFYSSIKIQKTKDQCVSFVGMESHTKKNIEQRYGHHNWNCTVLSQRGKCPRGLRIHRLRGQDLHKNSTSPL